MLQVNPVIPDELLKNQGKTLLVCDEVGCGASVEVKGTRDVEVRVGRGTLTTTVADLPKGWATSDPDDNPLNGAADYCPKHAHRISVVEPDAPEPVTETG